MQVFSQNFRGAPNGWSEIIDGNFLVGENSTGKSSFGQLLQLIWSTDFMINGTPTQLFSNLNDMRDFWSKMSGEFDKNSNFTAGYFRNKNKKNEAAAKLITYSHENAEIFISKISTLSGNNMAKLFYENGNLIKTTKKTDPKKTKIKSIRDAFFSFHHETQEETEIVLKKPLNNKLFGPILDAILNHSRDELEQGVAYRRPVFLSKGEVHAFGPIRSKPERVYFVGHDEFDSEGKFAPARLLKSISKGNIYKALKKFGAASGLYDDIIIKDIGKEVGRKAFTVTFKKAGRNFFADELGFGLSQIMPLITDSLTQPKDSILIIQQPELHLHPKAQAAFGEVLFEFLKDGRKFVVETHSDFIIDRFRLKIAKDKRKGKPKSQILFFHNSKRLNLINSIKINENGTLQKPPNKYRKFFLQEQFKVFDAL